MPLTQLSGTAAPKMTVEIWSDIMCPFCYIGKRHYEIALQNFADSHHVEVVWKSFQLDPSIPLEVEKGVSVSQYLSSRKGIPMDQVKVMHERVTQMASNAGLEYHLDNTVLFNSLKAHRIIQLAKTKGLGDLAEETLFHAYFTETKDLGDVDVLVALGKSIGLTEEEVRTALTSEVYGRLISDDIEEAQQIGVNGVPFFVFDRKYAVSGAQPPAAFVQTLEKSFGEWRAAHPATNLSVADGPLCTPDGCD